MGCGSSKESQVSDDKGHNFSNLNDAGLSVYLPTTGPLTAKDYKSRLASSEGTQTLYFPQSGITIRYAFVSQRGYYPDSPDKANQDSLCIHTHFGGDPEQAFFGVFDGHGEYGTQCSQFAKDKVPQNLLTSTHFATSPETAYHRSMVVTNSQLHRLPDVDDSMSGTTAIAALLRGRTVYVANVGDSRCVLAERANDRLTAVDLSFDQTPFRRDECERVKQCGARVLTLDQLEGLKDPNIEYWGTEEENDGDPPRLWAPNATYPGTAFTRSIGDSAAERIGVFAEPEVATKQLTANHPFLVIASDGVWEFLPSQSVVDMVSKFDDPQEACLSVVAESYRLWLQHETRTDDITMVVVQLQGLEDPVPPMQASASLGMDPGTRFSASTHGGMGRLPTMRMPAIEMQPSGLPSPSANGQPDTPSSSLAQQHSSSFGTSNRQDAGVLEPSIDNAAVSSSLTDLTADDIAMLEEAVANNFLFANLNGDERLRVFKAMHRVQVKAGELVIRQGELGDHFYVLGSGLFDVYLQQAPNTQPELVHTYGQALASSSSGNGAAQPRPSFGELALLYSKPRAATVVARTDGVLWSLHRNDFKAALQVSPHGRDLRALTTTLRSVELLQGLSGSVLLDLAEAMTEVTFDSGQYVIRQGEAGRDFFVITSGEVVCTVRKNVDDHSEVPKEVLHLSAGQYFGERALLTSAKRAANVIASGPVTLLSISRSRFEELIGAPLQALMDSEEAWRQQVSKQQELLALKSNNAALQQPSFSLDDLEARGLLFSTDCSALMLMEHKGSEDIFTVRVTSVADVSATNKQALVMRAREITRSLQPSLFVPGVVKSFKDSRVLAEVLSTVGLCTLDMLMHAGPLDEASAVFVAASVVLGLEHLRWSHVIYRGLSVHSIIVTEGGQVQLVDFRFARRDDGRAHTLCGNPEYLAPEVVENRGHSGSADLWALGVLIYCLLSGETPFAAPGDDELRIYRKIVSRTLTIPPHFSPEARSLVDALLQRQPSHRLGASPAGLADLKAHPWFAAINWESLMEHRAAPPQGFRDRIFTFEGVAYAQFEPKPYEGDTRWMESF